MPITTITGTTQRLANTKLKNSEDREGTDDYLVVDTRVEAIAVHEAMGRRDAWEKGENYPIEPERHGQGPWGDGRTWGHQPIIELANGKFAFVRTADMDRWIAAGAQEDTDDSVPSSVLRISR